MDVRTRDVRAIAPAVVAATRARGTFCVRRRTIATASTTEVNAAIAAHAFSGLRFVIARPSDMPWIHLDGIARSRAASCDLGADDRERARGVRPVARELARLFEALRRPSEIARLLGASADPSGVREAAVVAHDGVDHASIGERLVEVRACRSP